MLLETQDRMPLKFMRSKEAGLYELRRAKRLMKEYYETKEK
jgi:hypothetical protein